MYLPQTVEAATGTHALWHSHGWVHSDDMQRVVFDGLARCRSRDEAVKFLRSVGDTLQTFWKP